MLNVEHMVTICSDQVIEMATHEIKRNGIHKEEDGIATFVFLDLETTGLGGTGKQPRITELSLVAVHRDSLHDPCLGDTPRVLNKLTLCAYPMKVVEREAARITGLYNDSLFYQKDFDEGMSVLLNSFLQRQARPVCLIAHNGKNFDFPLLKAELQRIGKDLPDGVMCADSLEIFKSLDEDFASSSPRANGIEIHGNSNASAGTKRSLILSSLADAKETSSNSHVNAVNVGLPVPVFYNEQQLSNNVTPELQVVMESWKKEPPPAPCAKRYTSRMNQLLGDTTETEIQSVRKKLFEDKEKEAAEKCTPPPMKGSETPLSVLARARLKDGTNFKVKKKLFGDDGDGEPNSGNAQDIGSLKINNVRLDEASDNVDTASDGSRTPTSESLETQLYWSGDSIEKHWGGDSIENPSLLMEIEKLENQNNAAENTELLSWDDDDVSDDVLLASVLEAEEDEAQKNKLHLELTMEMNTTAATSTKKRPADFEYDFVPSPVPSTSGMHNNLSKPSTFPHKKQKTSYRLAELHKRVLGYDMLGAHRAEDDCLALIRIFHKAFNRVCPRTEQQAIPFTEIPPMYTSKIKTVEPCLGPDVFPYQLT